jgi:HSP20 family protein
MAKKPAKRKTSRKKVAKKKSLKRKITDKLAPKKKAPEHPLVALRQEMDSLFDRFVRGFPFEPLSSRLFDIEPFRDWGESWPALPTIDLSETKSGYLVEVELPGMSEDDIEVNLSDGMLTISGEKKEEKTDKRAHLSERRYGSFERSFRVSDSIDESKASAEFNKGVLKIKLPKIKRAQKEAQKINIKSN